MGDGGEKHGEPPVDHTASGKPHFEVLDGLRGTAALLVVLFHIQGITVLFDAPRLWLPHAYLAVDFFFALSGFVIGYAYDDRWRTMPVREFLIVRLIRLHPLVVLGALLGLVSYLGDPFAGGVQNSPLGLVLLAFATGLLALPSAPLQNRLGDSHPLNAPAWTLFQEYLGNLGYALVLRRLGLRMLLGLAAIAATASAATVLALGSYDTGWGLSNFWGAPVRLAYPFLAGLVIYRMQDRLPRVRIGWLWLSLLLTLAFVAPRLPDIGAVKLNGIYEGLCVLVLFPAILIAGRHSTGRPATVALCKLAGRISYPIYITHYPFVYLFMNLVSTQKAPAAVAIPVALCLFPFTIGFAWVAHRYWDLPIRAVLNRRRRVPGR